MANPYVIGIQFEKVGKIYYFDASNYPDLNIGSYVIVNTLRGLQLAQIIKINIPIESVKEELKPIERPATSRDLILKQMIVEKEKDAVKLVQDYLIASHQNGVKIASAEYSFDASRLTFFINSEADPKFNIKNFQNEISRKFPDTKVEIRQVGPRDIAKALGGMGACGLETRCCSKFLMEFQSISIRMAKTQDISLTPSEITGMCGRLRCCLLYEYEFYEEALKTLPKRKKIIQTPMGEGKVIQVLPLSQSVIVSIPDQGPRQFSNEELETGRIIPKDSAIKMNEVYDTGVEIIADNIKTDDDQKNKKQIPGQRKKTIKSRKGQQSRRSRR